MTTEQEETVAVAVKRALVMLRDLAHAQNTDVSFADALETQQVITVLGNWIEGLDEHWAEATLQKLALWKSPEELEAEATP